MLEFIWTGKQCLANELFSLYIGFKLPRFDLQLNSGRLLALTVQTISFLPQERRAALLSITCGVVNSIKLPDGFHYPTGASSPSTTERVRFLARGQSPNPSPSDKPSHHEALC